MGILNIIKSIKVNEDSEGLEYSCTNERLDAIVSGLDIQKDDRILSICGSGAQPLALLENVGLEGEVLAVDNNPAQIKFVQDVLKSIEFLKNGEICGLDIDHIAPRNQGYFSDKSRLSKIAENLDRLSFQEVDLARPRKIKKKFTKGYFSNSQVDEESVRSLFEKDALIYVTFASTLLPDNIDRFLWAYYFHFHSDLERFYEIDREKTKLACDLEKLAPYKSSPALDGEYFNKQWTPAVLRRK